MHTQSPEQLRQRFLREQQVSLNELKDVEDPAGAAAELIADSERPIGSINADERQARPATPAA